MVRLAWRKRSKDSIVGRVSLCLCSHSQTSIWKLNTNYKCLANSSGLLLANSYILNFLSLSYWNSSNPSSFFPVFLAWFSCLTSCPAIEQLALLIQSQWHIVTQCKGIFYTQPWPWEDGLLSKCLLVLKLTLSYHRLWPHARFASCSVRLSQEWLLEKECNVGGDKVGGGSDFACSCWLLTLMSTTHMPLYVQLQLHLVWSNFLPMPAPCSHWRNPSTN